MRTLLLLGIFVSLVVLAARQPGESYAETAHRLWSRMDHAIERLTAAANRDAAAPGSDVSPKPDKAEARDTVEPADTKAGDTAPTASGTSAANEADAGAETAPNVAAARTSDDGTFELPERLPKQTADASKPEPTPRENADAATETRARAAREAEDRSNAEDKSVSELYREAERLLESVRE